MEPESNGAWRLVAVVIDGEDAPIGRDTVLTSEGEAYTVTVNGRVYETGLSRTDASSAVRTSEVIPDTGPRAGQRLLQISGVVGDVLIACAGGPDADRPTNFTSEPGSGHTLSVWLRVK